MKVFKGWLNVGLVLVFLLSYGSGIDAKLEEMEVRLSASTLRPGEFLRLVVKAPADAVVKVNFLGTVKELPFYHNCFIGLIPVSCEDAPGTYRLTIASIQKEGSLTKLIPITVLERKFPEQRIKVPEQIRKEILAPANVSSDVSKTQAVREKAQRLASPPLWEDGFVWPLKGEITTKFGFTRYVNEIENGRHSGLDIAGAKGTPVVATNTGRVIFAGTLYQTGLTVIISHGLDLSTSYGHLSVIEAKEGELVPKGKVIGRVGATGLATGPHLHLTFRIGETTVDPYAFLDQKVEWEF